jgi:hypothetical protein
VNRDGRVIGNLVIVAQRDCGDCSAVVGRAIVSGPGTLVTELPLERSVLPFSAVRPPVNVLSSLPVKRSHAVADFGNSSDAADGTPKTKLGVGWHFNDGLSVKLDRTVPLAVEQRDQSRARLEVQFLAVHCWTKPDAAQGESAAIGNGSRIGRGADLLSIGNGDRAAADVEVTPKVLTAR